MADNERDAKLVLRAEDRATKTFEQVRKSIAELKTTLDQQAAAAARGEGSLDGLNKTLKQIQQTADDLNKQKSALLAFERAGDGAEKASARVTKATEAFETFRDKLANAGTATDAQTARLAKLAESVTRAQSSLDAANGRIDSARNRLTAFGLSTEGVSAQIEHINRTFGELPVLLTRAQTAVDGFGAAQAQAVAQAAAAAEASRKAAAEQAAIEKQRQDAITLSLRLVQQRAQEEAKAAAETAAANQRALESAQAAGQRANTFGKIGADAIAAATDLSRFARTTDDTTAHLIRLAEAVRSIVSPTLSSVQTLGGAIDVIDASAARVASGQKLRASQAQELLNGLTQAQSALVKQAGNIDAYQRQEVALNHLEVDLGNAATKVRQLGEAIRLVPSDVERLTVELRQAQAELERVGSQTQAARTKFQQLGETLRQGGIDTGNIASEITRIGTAARSSAGTATTLQTALGGGGRGFLGLRAYELQNLSYQINDVFTSLASGISPMQTLAQQGGQIVQLFPGLISGFIRFLPVLLPVGVALGAVAYGLSETYKQAAAARAFNAQLELSANTAGYAADALAKAQIEFEHLGVSAKDSQAAIRLFTQTGFDPSGLDKFLLVVKAIADGTGKSIPEAAEKYKAALFGGYDAVAQLNDITGTLTNSQLDQIKALYDNGDATKALSIVTQAYERDAQRVSDAARSEWSRSTLAFGNAFRELIAQFNAAPAAAGQLRGPFGELIAIINRVTSALQDAKTAYVAFTRFRAQSGAAGATNFGITGNYQEELKKRYAAAGLDENGNPIAAKNAQSARPQEQRRTAEQARFLDQQQTELAAAKKLTDQERLRNAEVVARRKAEAVGFKDQATLEKVAANARAIEQDKIDKEHETASNKAAAAARKEENAQAKAAREAESRQNQINALALELRNTYLSFDTNAKADPFKAIQNKATEAVNKIRAQFDKLAKLGVFKVDGKTFDDFKKVIENNAAIETQQATQKKQEDDINALLTERTQRLAAIEDAVKRGDITAVQGVEQSQAVVNDLQPKITALATTALDFNKALRTATYDPKLEEFIAKLQRDLADAAGKNEIKTVLDNALKDAQNKLAALVSTRDEFVKAQNALVTAGLQTDIAAQKAIQTEYTNTRKPILAAADAVQAVIDKMVQLGLISPEAAASLTASLGLTRAQTQKLNADVVALNNAALQALSGSISDFIESLGTQIANVIAGTSSLKDALQGIAQAALSFAASFTKAIAQAIIQLLALKIAKAALGAVGIKGFHDGGVIGASQGSFSRKVPSEVFLGAARYHSGGVAGLLPDEVPAILQKGEEVLTANDPRHRDNGGLNPQPAPVLNAKIVNLFDAGEAVSAGANTRTGEQAILNVIRQNPSAVREAIGNGG